MSRKCLVYITVQTVVLQKGFGTRADKRGMSMKQNTREITNSASAQRTHSLCGN